MAAATPPHAPPANASPAIAVASDPPGRDTAPPCAELVAQKAWPAVDRCATGLTSRDKERAAQLHALATQELQNEELNKRARQSLRDGALKDAQLALGQITASSVYLAPLREVFARTEQQQIKEARRKAQSLASAHDCAGLQRAISELAETATESVMTAARAIHCDEQPAERVVAKAPATPPPPPTAPAPTERPAKTPSPTAPHAGRCEPADVDDLMTRAAIQYANGAATAALPLVRVALGCRQTERMYWLAVLYACAAHDLASAKQYFANVPANLRSGLETKCQADGLGVRDP